jgi:nitrous oxidase accessory protein NosD
MVESRGNTIHDNDFRGNHSSDCYDSTAGSGTPGTGNTWTDNLGDDSSPAGICAPAP